jgi:hypothetical protein
MHCSRAKTMIWVPLMENCSLRIIIETVVRGGRIVD